MKARETSTKPVRSGGVVGVGASFGKTPANAIGCGKRIETLARRGSGTPLDLARPKASFASLSPADGETRPEPLSRWERMKAAEKLRQAADAAIRQQPIPSPESDTPAPDSLPS